MPGPSLQELNVVIQYSGSGPALGQQQQQHSAPQLAQPQPQMAAHQSQPQMVGTCSIICYAHSSSLMALT